MKSLIRTWLDEIRANGLSLSEKPGSGANQNLWCASLPSSIPITAAELVEFLREAMAVRGELVTLQTVRPVCSYAWHDEMAGQLRLSTACCTRETLPFSSELTLLDDPTEIADGFAHSPYRDGIPSHELREVALDDGDDDLPGLGARKLKVWAIEWL